MNNGENHRKGASGEGKGLARAKASPEQAQTVRDVASNPEIPDVPGAIKRGVYNRFGFRGLVALALAGCLGWVWWNWEEVRQRWPVREVVEWIERDDLNRADSDRFTVAIAHLENDPERKYESLIFEALNEGFAGQDENAVQILRFDRMIERGGGDLEAAVEKAHQTARAYLDESGADVLIWGAVLGSGEQSIPKLYWTPARDLDRARDWGRYATEDLALPEVFWTDLADILQLLVVTRGAEFRSLKGQFVADRLGPFVEKVRRLLAVGGQGWTEDTRARVQLVLADSLSTLGEQAGKNEPLEEAIERYREVLTHYTRERVPLAKTQNNLGIALRRLGERESGTQRLEEAVAAYRAALKEWTREKVPLHWAMTQNNLGAALQRLGERESGTERLEQAVEAYREALQEWTREKVPLNWATTQNNLGNALTSLGERESGMERLEQAVAAYRAALKEYTREKVPLHWAATQNNLGTALTSLGERESGTKRLEEAVEAYREALEERTRKKVPLDWAITQNNLGTALKSLGERENGTARLEEAVEAFRAALQERTREKVPLDWAQTQHNLGNALRSLGERSRDAELVCDALGTHLAGWEVFTQGKAGHYAAMGYLLNSGSPYMLWSWIFAGAAHLTMDLYGAGSTATACWRRRKNSLPRLRDVRRLNRNVNSSR